MKQSNEWYLDGLRRRQSEVLHAIFREFFPGIRTYVCNNSGTEEDAKDVFMDGIEVVYRKVRNGNLVLHASFYSFLFAICKNQWLNVLRKKKREVRVTPDDPELLRLSEEVSEQMEETERFKLLREKFADLPEGCRRLLNLVWHSDKSISDIALELGFSIKYIRKRKHICKNHLSDLVKQDRRYLEIRHA